MLEGSEINGMNKQDPQFSVVVLNAMFSTLIYINKVSSKTDSCAILQDSASIPLLYIMGRSTVQLI